MTFLETAYTRLVEVGNFGAKVNGMKNPYGSAQNVQKLGRTYAQMDTNLQISKAMEEGDSDKLDAIASAETGIPRAKLTVVQASDGAGETFVKQQPIELSAGTLKALADVTIKGVAKLIQPAKRGRKRKAKP